MRAGSLAIAAAAVLHAGCTYEKVVNYRPFLAGVPGAVVGEDVTVTPITEADPTTGATSLHVENDGTVTIRPGSIRGLMSIIARTISDDPAVSLGEELAQDERVVIRYARSVPKEERASEINRRLFVEEVLSSRIVQEYRARGLDPVQAHETLKAARADVMALFNRIPMAQHSPDVRMIEIDRNLFRIQATGLTARDLRWTNFDVHFERGGWRLVWFGR